MTIGGAVLQALLFLIAKVQLVSVSTSGISKLKNNKDTT